MNIWAVPNFRGVFQRLRLKGLFLETRIIKPLFPAEPENRARRLPCVLSRSLTAALGSCRPLDLKARPTARYPPYRLVGSRRRPPVCKPDSAREHTDPPKIPSAVIVADSLCVYKKNFTKL